MKKKRIEVRKPNIIDRIVFALTLPDIPSKDDREGPFKILKTKEYNLMKKMVDRIPGYTTQLQTQNTELQIQSELLTQKDEELITKEKQRMKLIAKVGGLTTSLRREKNKNEELVKVLADKEIEIDIKDKEIEMLKNKGKRKKNVESYKNYFEARKELEKREQNDKS